MYLLGKNIVELDDCICSINASIGVSASKSMRCSFLFEESAMDSLCDLCD